LKVYGYPDGRETHNIVYSFAVGLVNLSWFTVQLQSSLHNR